MAQLILMMVLAKVQLRDEMDTVWLTQLEMAELPAKRQTITSMALWKEQVGQIISSTN